MHYTMLKNVYNECYLNIGINQSDYDLITSFLILVDSTITGCKYSALGVDTRSQVHNIQNLVKHSKLYSNIDRHSTSALLD